MDDMLELLPAEIRANIYHFMLPPISQSFELTAQIPVRQSVLARFQPLSNTCKARRAELISWYLSLKESYYSFTYTTRLGPINPSQTVFNITINHEQWARCKRNHINSHIINTQLSCTHSGEGPCPTKWLIRVRLWGTQELKLIRHVKLSLLGQDPYSGLNPRNIPEFNTIALQIINSCMPGLEDLDVFVLWAISCNELAQWWSTENDAAGSDAVRIPVGRRRYQVWMERSDQVRPRITVWCAWKKAQQHVMVLEGESGLPGEKLRSWPRGGGKPEVNYVRGYDHADYKEGRAIEQKEDLIDLF